MKHNHPPNFGRRVAGCPRCQELSNGSKPVPSWGEQKRQREAATSRAIQNHDCIKSRCGAVCTAFQW